MDNPTVSLAFGQYGSRHVGHRHAEELFRIEMTVTYLQHLSPILEMDLDEGISTAIRAYLQKTNSTLQQPQTQADATNVLADLSQSSSDPSSIIAQFPIPPSQPPVAVERSPPVTVMSSPSVYSQPSPQYNIPAETMHMFSSSISRNNARRMKSYRSFSIQTGEDTHEPMMFMPEDLSSSLHGGSSTRTAHVHVQNGVRWADSRRSSLTRITGPQPYSGHWNAPQVTEDGYRAASTADVSPDRSPPESEMRDGFSHNEGQAASLPSAGTSWKQTFGHKSSRRSSMVDVWKDSLLRASLMRTRKDKRSSVQ
ncbi:hypothetical protein EIP91_008596 [Steccherinum ochraceum]|uniref:Uncharacterized protein n=1 Tax=Steccherinum ochraceum TaxID=92696 RepID=A0A4R0RKB4_9APHY|nr:hypothetical protein EIP91_008596 [Steccherinum ochraceum]